MVVSVTDSINMQNLASAVGVISGGEGQAQGILDLIDISLFINQMCTLICLDISRDLYRK